MARRRPAPLAPLAPVRSRPWAYAVAAIDNRGRIAARALLHDLGCPPGTTVSISEQAGLLVVTAGPAGTGTISPQGHLHLPPRIRRRHGITTGCQVLLVADPGARRLVIHPPAAIDAMVAGCYATVFGGDAASGGAAARGGGTA